MFSKTFSKSHFEFSYPRVFAPLQSFPKAMMLITRPLAQGISRYQEGVIYEDDNS
jgi:hypothetical protein